MPALLTRLRPAEEGWSKPHIDDLIEKLFTASFPAFKFPDRERLHVSCGVQLCRGQCPKVEFGLLKIQNWIVIAIFNTWFKILSILNHYSGELSIWRSISTRRWAAIGQNWGFQFISSNSTTNWLGSHKKWSQI